MQDFGLCRFYADLGVPKYCRPKQQSQSSSSESSKDFVSQRSDMTFQVCRIEENVLVRLSSALIR